MIVVVRLRRPTRSLSLSNSIPLPDSSGRNGYRVFDVVTGSALMSSAGTLAGLLAIGSGALKVIALDKAHHDQPLRDRA